MLLAASAALYTFLRADEDGRPGAYFTAGALAGLAALAKLNGGLVFAGFILYLAWAGWRDRPSLRIRLRNGLWTSAGFLLTFGLPFAALLAFVPGAAFQTITFHAGKRSLAEGTFLTRPFIRLIQFVGNHNYGIVPVAAAGVALGSGRVERKTALLLFAAAAPFAVLFLPGRFFIRYVVCAMVPLALFFGVGLEVLVRWKKGRIPALTVAIILIALSLGPTFQPVKLSAYDYGTRALVAYVQERTEPDASIFGDDPFINFLARRPCPGRLVDVSEAWTKGGLITARRYPPGMRSGANGLDLRREGSFGPPPRFASGLSAIPGLPERKIPLGHDHEAGIPGRRGLPAQVALTPRRPAHTILA